MNYKVQTKKNHRFILYLNVFFSISYYNHMLTRNGKLKSLKNEIQKGSKSKT